MSLCRVGGDLKKGGVRVLYCLDEEYVAVSVVGLDKRCQGYDELEELDEDREAARVASGGNIQPPTSGSRLLKVSVL